MVKILKPNSGGVFRRTILTALALGAAALPTHGAARAADRRGGQA